MVSSLGGRGADRRRWAAAKGRSASPLPRSSPAQPRQAAGLAQGATGDVPGARVPRRTERIQLAQYFDGTPTDRCQVPTEHW